ncbi:bicoid stability factor [Oratosquilla oratoria]|uniref:bicoid stability factor n=1 Tax=Oratosquilla oratoria TaxID=337810 RepID=UPI003F76F99B
MAAILRSANVFRIFSGLKRSLTVNASRYEGITVQKFQVPRQEYLLIRNFAAQKPLENIETSPSPALSLDKALTRLDSDIRRTGRIALQDIEDILNEVKSFKSASSNQSLLLIRCCGSLVPEEDPDVRTKLVHNIWETLHKFGVPMDISHYNALLRVYLENEFPFAPNEFLADLEKKGMEPNRVTYQRLISRYCQNGDIDGATKILEYMKEKQLPVGENIFNALITGHSRANDLESAKSILGIMEGAGLELSTETYCTLLSAYAEHGEMELLWKTLEECQSADVVLNHRDFMDLIYALAANGHEQHVPELMEKVPKGIGYNQDAINLIFRLINIGKDDVAFKQMESMVLPQNSEGVVAPVGYFFIKHLVKVGRPVSQVIQYCQLMKTKGLNVRAIEKALEISLTMGQRDSALALIKVLQENQSPVRPHYFWPIFRGLTNSKETDKVYDMIKEMQAMEVPVTLETMVDYIIPAVAQDESDPEPAIAQMKECDISVPNIINAFISYHIQNGNLQTAADLIDRYRVRVLLKLRRALSEAYLKSTEANAAAVLLGQMGASKSDEQTIAESGSESDSDGEKVTALPQNEIVVGNFLLDVVYMSRPQQMIEKLEPMLKALEERGLSIEKSQATKLQARLGEHITETVSASIERLASGTLVAQPLQSRSSVPLRQQTIAELERRAMELQIKNMPSSAILAQLLINYARNKDVEKAEEVKQKLDAEEYVYGIGQYVLLIDMYVNAGHLESAMKLLKELQQREPEVVLSPIKTIKLASLMVAEEKLDDAQKSLEDGAKGLPDETEQDQMILNHLCWKMLNSMAEKGDVASIKKLHKVLFDCKYVQPSTMQLGPLIKAHFANDDLKGAMEEFTDICRTYKVTPWKHELTTRFIKLEDTENLQNIMDLSIEIHGEMNSLYDLIFGFIECGRIRQARKILETPGLRARHNRLELRCERYAAEEKVVEMENLISVTRDLFDVDRQMMFNQLLQVYKKKNNFDKALGIWTSMQEENIEPSEAFLYDLGTFLKSNGKPVPFVMPEVKTQEPTKSNKLNEKFNEAVKSDLEAAVDTKKKVESSGKQLSVTSTSKLIEAMVKEERYDEALRLTKEMMGKGQHPTPKIFKFLLNKLASVGDVDSFLYFDEHLSQSVKKAVSFDNRMCNAFVSGNKAVEYLDLLRSDLKRPDFDASALGSRFPKGGILSFMEKFPEQIPTVTELAGEYATRGVHAPASCVWSFLYSEGRVEEANEIFNKHLQDNSGILLFGRVLAKARELKDASMVIKLAEFLETQTSSSEGAKGVIYSCVLDVHSQNGHFEEGLKVLESALKTVNIDKLNKTALNRLKSGLESADKTFPYTIPVKGSA